MEAKMKILLSSLVLLCVIFTFLLAQEIQEAVIYLKNGSKVRGTIMEVVPSESLKIKTSDGKILVFKAEEVLKIVKEPQANTMNISEKQSFESKKYDLGNVGLLFNPIGVIQFGPILEVEFKVGPSTVIGPHARFLGMGILYHAVADYDEASLSDFGVGIHFKQFFGSSSGPHRFFIGAIAEYGWGNGTDFDDEWNSTLGEYEDSEYELTYIGIATNLGYRWRFQSGFFLSLGGIIGFSRELEDKRTSPSTVEYELDTHPYGMAELSLGIEF
jgi:hypothetical protein